MRSEIILCVPGPWDSKEALEQAIEKTEWDYVYTDGVVVDEANQSIGLVEHYEADENVSNGSPIPTISAIF